MPPRTAEIMVVDDHPSNVLLLEQMLARKGYRVRPFSRGRDAFESARALPPDLVLLDINMPELDGYQTCKLFKQEPALASIPVIFLSAISQTAGKIEAFRSGGVDYISKPFEFEEVVARVNTHVELSRLQSRLRDENIQLESVVAARTRELAAALAQLSRLDEAKSDFLRMISHELRTPLNGLLGAAELILSEIPPGEQTTELAGILAESRQRILALVDSSLLLTQIEIAGGEFQSAQICVADLLADAAHQAAGFAASRSVAISLPAGDIGWTSGNRELLLRAWQALFETAVRFARPGCQVTAAARQGKDIEVTVEAPSGSIPAAVLPRFFQVFGVSEASTAAGNLGLEPAMAKQVLGLFGSAVGVENLEPAGIRITVSCPSSGSSAIQRDRQAKAARG